jgi:hypothetical protein
MNAVIPNRKTTSALKSPIRAPSAKATASVVGTISQDGSAFHPRPVGELIHAVTIAASAMVDSIDRSIWPAIITIASATDRMPTKVDCSRMLKKIPGWA